VIVTKRKKKHKFIELFRKHGRLSQIVEETDEIK